MMLDDIFSQSMEDPDAVTCHGDGYTSRLSYGVRILKDSDGVIKITNTHKRGDFGAEISAEEYEIFFQMGWEWGVAVIAIANNLKRIDKYIKIAHETKVTKRYDKKIAVVLKQIAYSTNRIIELTEKQKKVYGSF